MKHYQDHDPLHGHGKALPKPKQPTKDSPRKLLLFNQAYNIADALRRGLTDVRCCLRGHGMN